MGASRAVVEKAFIRAGDASTGQPVTANAACSSAEATTNDYQVGCDCSWQPGGLLGFVPV